MADQHDGTPNPGVGTDGPTTPEGITGTTDNAAEGADYVRTQAELMRETLATLKEGDGIFLIIASPYPNPEDPEEVGYKIRTIAAVAHAMLGSMDSAFHEACQDIAMADPAYVAYREQVNKDMHSFIHQLFGMEPPRTN